MAKAKTEEQLKLPRYFASVIVMNKKGKVLLGTRKEDGIVTPPGGHAQDHETPTQAAVRELFEETAIAAKEKDLVELPTIDTVHGKVCHCYLLEVKDEDPIPDLDPDKEVSSWEWFKEDELPVGLRKDPRRFESVRNAFMKFHGIMKGGPGSGVKGHTTAKQVMDLKGHEQKLVSLADKLVETNPFKELLHKLENGAIVEHQELKSGKPMYLSVDQAMAHGYTPDDYREAGNIHWDKAQGMSKQIEKIRQLGKEPPPEMTKIVKFHERQFKQMHNMAEKTQKRATETEAAIKERKSAAAAKAKEVKKSVVMLGQADGAEVDTGKFTQEHSTNLSDWEAKIYNMMQGYSYGEIPRSLNLDKGIMHLTKVDDGMYSGYITLVHDVPGEDQPMLDTAKVRIERMSAPSLAQFLLAKEYVLPNPVSGASPGNNSMPMGGEMTLANPTAVEGLTESLMVEPFSESMPQENPPQPILPESHPLDRKLEMLRLIDKLLG
jgi:8-oxo-dGTP pyrophosphatase MutT (NUDIX family)